MPGLVNARSFADVLYDARNRNDDWADRLNEAETKPQSLLARAIGSMLGGGAVFDDDLNVWMCRRSAEADNAEEGVFRQVSVNAMKSEIKRLLSQISDSFSASTLNGVTDLVKLDAIAPAWVDDRRFMPMQNGVLDTETLEMRGYENMNFKWSLPYSYDPGASCPAFKRWLMLTTERDKEFAFYLLCVLRAILTGRYDLQIFFEISGGGGTGKSTFGDIAKWLIGKEGMRSTTTDLIENDRHETTNIFGKRFVLIEESDKFVTKNNVRKALTGGSEIAMRPMYRQCDESFVFTGMLMMINNKLESNPDLSSGGTRRRHAIIFNRYVTDADKRRYDHCGGLNNRLRDEMPGVLNLLLKISDEQVTETLRNPPSAIQKSRIEAELETNHISAFCNERLVRVPRGQESLIGKAPTKGDDQYDIEEMTRTKIYTAYLDFCERSGNKSINLRNFSSAILENLRYHKIDTEKKQLRVGGSIGAGLTGIGLRDAKQNTPAYLVIPPLYEGGSDVILGQTIGNVHAINTDETIQMDEAQDLPDCF